MKLVIQKVSSASVEVEGNCVGKIKKRLPGSGGNREGRYKRNG